MSFEKPTVSEESFIINEDLTVYYTLFKDNYTFTRPANSWSRWREFPYLIPNTNNSLMENHNDGVELKCCEHVSVVTQGTATYTLITNNGPKDYLWEYGTHNVDNGLGYLPTDIFTRVFHTGFELCCIVQPILGRTTEASYSFEVVRGAKTLDNDTYAVHYATGTMAKQTQFNLPSGTEIDIGANDLAIAIYLQQ
jgi:hypothetical protein